MKIKLVSLRLLTLLTWLLLISAVCFADTIKLKNGSVIKGKVVTYSQQGFTVIPDLGSSSRRSASPMVIAIEDVESIEFDTPEAAPSENPEANPKRSETSRDKPPNKRATDAPATNRENTKETLPATDPLPNKPTSSGEATLAAEKSVSVESAKDWTSTEIRVQRGQRIIITAEGEVDLGNNQRTGPGGLSLADNRKLMPGRPTGSLIAVVGDDNDDFVFIGRAAEFTATHSGILFLSINEGNLKDNTGSFLARVKVLASK